MAKDYFLRKLSEAVDFRFANRLCSRAYSEMERPGYEPLKSARINQIDRWANAQVRP